MQATSGIASHGTLYVVDNDPLQPPQPRRRDFSRQVTHLPLVQDENSLPVSETEAGKVWQALEDTGSSLPDRIHTVIADLVMEVLPELEEVPNQGNSYVITRTELIGALSKAAIRSSAQVIVDTGSIMQEARQLQELYDQPPADDPQTN